MAVAHKSRRPVRRRSGEIEGVVVPPAAESGVRLSGPSGSSDRDTIVEASSDELRLIASATLAAANGFEVCGKRARTKDVALRMASLATDARALAGAIGACVPGGVRKPSTSERLRWEWLASTAALLDGGAEGRVADEANRHLTAASTAAARVDDDELRDLVARVHTLAARGRVVAGSSRASMPSSDAL